ncbi:MAG: 1-deoxy-D-xylulose-5-phosphate reductoisomerase [Spirochaetia bacterium]
MRKVIILGASGTIGQNALRVCRRYPHHLDIVGLHVHHSLSMLEGLTAEFPNARCISSANLDAQEAQKLGLFAHGESSLEKLIKETSAHIVLNGICGSAGFFSSFWALESGKDLALANKETLVIGGALLLELAKKMQKKIIPVDSEHWALFSLIEHMPASRVKKLILTASGGPFRNFGPNALENVSPDQAATHPTWNMGRKISIDSASMANKGLEIIEAYRLFAIPLENISVVVHPQSLVHAMIQTQDGALHAHMSAPTMELPIQNALLYPQILAVPQVELDFSQMLQMTFESINANLMGMIDLAYEVCKRGDPYPAIYNASNEAAVQLFEEKKIRFTEIPVYVEKAISEQYNMLPSFTKNEIFSLHQKVYESVLLYK